MRKTEFFMDPLANKKINKAFSRRDFTSCIKIFKKYFDDASLDSNSSYIVGISYLYKFEFELARKYLNLAIELDNANTSAIMALAAIKLRQRNLEAATELYLKVLDIDGNNKLALQILNRLKNCENIDKLIRKMRFKDFIPMPSFYISFLSIFTLLMIIVVIVLLITILIYNLLTK